MTATRRRPRFRLLEHTADVGLTATGETLADALGAAVRGVVAVTFDPRRIRPREERVVSVTDPDPARRVVRLLDEVVFLEETEGFLPASATVTETSNGLVARLVGERFDSTRHIRVGPAVKAITYHQLEVTPGPPARLRLILDV